MKFSRNRVLAISTSAIVATLASGTPPAAAQNLFDMLFRNNQAGRVQREVPPVVEQRPVQRAAPPRVAGPQYYTYKADNLVTVDFAAITLNAMADDDSALVAPQGVDLASVGSTPVVAEAEALPDASLDVRNAVLLPTADIEAGEMSNEQPEAPEALPIQAPRLSADDIAALQDFSLLAEKEAAEAIVAHYSADASLIWVSEGRPNTRARQALRTLGDAASHGLDVRDYAVSVPASEGGKDAVALEMELSARLLRYARDAQSGRVDPNRISGYHDFKREEFDGAAFLAALRDSDDVAALLEAQHPQNAQYRALRAELEMLHASAENEIVIAPKTVIKPGQTNPEFPKILALIESRADEALKAEHGETLSLHRASETYVQALVPVIKAAQRLAGVGDDGVIGPRTIQAIAGESKATRIEKVLVALEQLRWLPSDLTDRHVFINTPAFEASYFENGEERLTMRTVVGRLDTQTYFFQDQISYVEFHPYWGMPRSILVNTYIPRVLKDPSYFDRNGYEVVSRNGQTVSSTSIDWTAYGSNIPFDVRQRPGPSNALGEMKIMFPNKHAIYMHDTPEKHLFSRENRALSNGCIRLSDPRAMAAAVLGWSREQVEKRLEGKHGRQNLDIKVPVYVAYFTAWPDQSGKVHYYNDVYSRDEKTRDALNRIESVRSLGA